VGARRKEQGAGGKEQGARSRGQGERRKKNSKLKTQNSKRQQLTVYLPGQAERKTAGQRLKANSRDMNGSRLHFSYVKSIKYRRTNEYRQAYL